MCGGVKQTAPEMMTGMLTDKVVDDVRSLLAAAGADAWHQHYSLVSPEEIAGLAADGVMVNLWTLNDVDEARRMSKAGAGAIITDFPQRLTVL